MAPFTEFNPVVLFVTVTLLMRTVTAAPLAETPLAPLFAATQLSRLICTIPPAPEKARNPFVALPFEIESRMLAVVRSSPRKPKVFPSSRTRSNDTSAVPLDVGLTRTPPLPAPAVFFRTIVSFTNSELALLG